jgi:hypothetical protein
MVGARVVNVKNVDRRGMNMKKKTAARQARRDDF